MGRPGDSHALIDAAAAIGALLCEKAVERPDGSITWLGPSPAAPAATSGRALGPQLYDGTSGIAFFLAALGHHRQDRSTCLLARTAIEPLRRTFAGLAADPERAQRLKLPIGGLVGAGGFAYGMVRMSLWLDDPSLLESARLTASLITPERIAEDQRLDVTSGAAGALLALLALDAVDDSALPNGESPLALAARCGTRLLERRSSVADGPRAWPGVDRPPISGFGHGAAGIAYALIRLHQRTGEPALHEAALEGIAFERTLYVREARNWIDPRTDRLLEQSAWCHGAPGIALARAAALGWREDPALHTDLDEILASVRSMADTPVDHLCCGNLGRADILHTAGRALGDSAMVGEAHGLAGRAIDRAAGRGHYGLRIDDREPGSEVSLFRGLSGIGFALLRLAAPDLLPSVLLLE